jgi:predicted secreted protein
MVTLGPADDGRVVPVAAGQRVETVLPQSGATGYRWVLDPLPAGVELVEERTEPGGFGLVGGTGQRVFAVVVRDPAAGPVRLTARLRREWEPPEAAVQSFSVNLTPVQ